MAPKKNGSNPKAAVSTSRTRSPRADSARPSVATRLVLPTPPASEKTAVAGGRATMGGGIGSTGAGVPSKIPRNAYQREVSRSREPCSVSSASRAVKAREPQTMRTPAPLQQAVDNLPWPMLRDDPHLKATPVGLRAPVHRAQPMVCVPAWKSPLAVSRIVILSVKVQFPELAVARVFPATLR